MLDPALYRVEAGLGKTCTYYGLWSVLTSYPERRRRCYSRYLVFRKHGKNIVMYCQSQDKCLWLSHECLRRKSRSITPICPRHQLLIWGSRRMAHSRILMKWCIDVETSHRVLGNSRTSTFHSLLHLITYFLSSPASLIISWLTSVVEQTSRVRV